MEWYLPFIKEGWILAFIIDYGYLAVFLGSLIEGEVIILTASAFAASGTLSIFYVWLISFLGTLFADQILFYFGRYYNNKDYGYFEPKKIQINKLLLSYPKTFILSFRFIYGIRIMSPIVIGIANFPVVQFTYLNFFSALLWSSISCSIGYFAGQSVFKHYYMSGIIMLFIYVCCIWILHRRLNKQ